MNEHIVLVGVGGTGMSCIANLLLDLGYTNLVGIDSTQSETTDKLVQKGMHIIIGHGIYQGHPQDVVIYSAATPGSPEVQFARTHRQDDHKHPGLVVSYFEFLGELSKYFITIAIAGTHGKSTTTALTAETLYKHHPSFGLSMMGAGVNQRGGQSFVHSQENVSAIRRIMDHCLGSHRTDRYEDSKKYLFVVEACEFNRQFLSLDVEYAVILNLELDHADTYGTFANYLDTFVTFAQKVKKHIYMLPGAIGQEKLCEAVGSETAKNISLVPLHHFDFTHLLGSHNHGNASLALAVCKDLLSITIQDLAEQALVQTLNSFQGLRRRAEALGTSAGGALVYTDYGHHPSELHSTLAGIREKYPTKKITCIFQPHQARRVMEFWGAFTDTLRACDKVLIYDIYAARESLPELKKQFTQRQFDDVHTIEELGLHFADACNGTYTTDFSAVSTALDAATADDLVIVFTAGDLDGLLRTRYIFR